MRELTIDDFARQRGKPFKVDVEGGAIELRLAHVQELPGSGRSAGSFRLEFHGPLESLLQQGTYPFHLGSERAGIFIVPLGPTGQAIGPATGQAMRYEALFL